MSGSPRSTNTDACDDSPVAQQHRANLVAAKEQAQERARATLVDADPSYASTLAAGQGSHSVVTTATAETGTHDNALTLPPSLETNIRDTSEATIPVENTTAATINDSIVETANTTNTLPNLPDV